MTNQERATILSRMRNIANEYNLGIVVNAAAWESDLDKDIIFIPLHWTIADADYYTWEQYVLKDIWEQYTMYKEILSKVPHFVYSFYHELGHHAHDKGGDLMYPHEATRLLIGKLPEQFRELGTKAYFEIPEEVDATEWAIEQIVHHMAWQSLKTQKYWWEV